MNVSGEIALSLRGRQTPPCTICTQDALEFPSQGYIRQVIRKNKIVTHSKNMLRADPDKFDVKRRAPVGV